MDARLQPLLQLLLGQSHHNAWANHRLLVACAQLSQAEVEAPRTASSHSGGFDEAAIWGAADSRAE